MDNLTKKEMAFLKREMKERRAFYYQWGKAMAGSTHSSLKKEAARAKAEGKMCGVILKKLKRR